MRSRDLLLGEAADRAGRRLRRAYDLALAAGRPAPVEPRLVESLADGSVTYLVATTPAMSIECELGFAAFESAVYRPAPDRCPLEHGAFTVTCVPAERDAVVEGLRRRLAVYARSLA